MIEWISILLIIVCIAVWYYSQSADSYSLSQIKEAQISTQLLHVWEEKKPVVISEVRSMGIWSPDLQQTRFWGAQPVWGQYESGHEVKTDASQHLAWAEILGIAQIERETMRRWFDLSWMMSTRTEAHIGAEGLRQTYGWATVYTSTAGEMRCILLHRAQKARLPPGWKGLRWRDATVAHHPMWTQVQYIEVILRPGTVLCVPPHWIVAIESANTIWWTRTDVHHPISSIAQRLMLR